MSRGDPREEVFRDDLDRKNFLQTLGAACQKDRLASALAKQCQYLALTPSSIPQTAPILQNAAIDRLVHLHAPVAMTVIDHNDSLRYLWDVVDWVEDSHNWQ